MKFYFLFLYFILLQAFLTFSIWRWHILAHLTIASCHIYSYHASIYYGSVS